MSNQNMRKDDWGSIRGMLGRIDDRDEEKETTIFLSGLLCGFLISTAGVVLDMLLFRYLF